MDAGDLIVERTTSSFVMQVPRTQRDADPWAGVHGTSSVTFGVPEGHEGSSLNTLSTSCYHCVPVNLGEKF